MTPVVFGPAAMVGTVVVPIIPTLVIGGVRVIGGRRVDYRRRVDHSRRVNDGRWAIHRFRNRVRRCHDGGEEWKAYSDGEINMRSGRLWNRDGGHDHDSCRDYEAFHCSFTSYRAERRRGHKVAQSPNRKRAPRNRTYGLTGFSPVV